MDSNTNTTRYSYRTHHRRIRGQDNPSPIPPEVPRRPMLTTITTNASLLGSGRTSISSFVDSSTTRNSNMLQRSSPNIIDGSISSNRIISRPSVREIHKNAWLKRIFTSYDKKGVQYIKKTEKWWVVFCVHDDSEAFLEFYVDQKQASSHKPTSRVNINGTRHVSTAIIVQDNEYQFTISLDSEVINLIASDQDQQSEWVESLRGKLREMNLLNPKDNIYSTLPECRSSFTNISSTRDPNSPLPAPPQNCLASSTTCSSSLGRSNSDVTSRYPSSEQRRFPLDAEFSVATSTFYISSTNSSESEEAERTKSYENGNISHSERRCAATGNPIETVESHACSHSAVLNNNSSSSSQQSARSDVNVFENNFEPREHLVVVIPRLSSPPPPSRRPRTRKFKTDPGIQSLESLHSMPSQSDDSFLTTSELTSRKTRPSSSENIYEHLCNSTGSESLPSFSYTSSPPAIPRRKNDERNRGQSGREAQSLSPVRPSSTMETPLQSMIGLKLGEYNISRERNLNNQASAANSLVPTCLYTTKAGGHVPLKESQVMRLNMEINHSAGVHVVLRKKDCLDTIAFVDYLGAVWIAGWKQLSHPVLYYAFHVGDQIMKIGGENVSSSEELKRAIKNSSSTQIEFIIRRMPFGKVFVLKRSREGEPLGLVAVGNCAEISEVVEGSLAAREGLATKAPCPGKDAESYCNWFLTEINNRPLSLFARETDVRDRLNAVGKEISILVQPSELVKHLKKQLKNMRNFKEYLVV